MEELKEQSSVIVNRLETEVKDLKTEIKNLKAGATVTAEDFQLSQSQIIAYKKQLDACKKELDEERRRGHVMQDRIDALNGFQEQATLLEAEVCFVYHLVVGVMNVCLSQNKELKKDVGNFHNERSRANRLEQEVEQLRRSVSNYQMEQTRANRLQQEMNQLMVQYRELENRNGQLKTANQVCTVDVHLVVCTICINT